MRPFRATLLGLLILSVLGLSLLTSTPPSGAQAGLQAATGDALRWQDKVDPRVFEALSAGQAEFLIYMKQQADLSGASKLATKEEKGRYVYERLTATARATQPNVTRTLGQLGAQHQAFWVSNTISAKGDLSVVQAVASLPEVAAVYPNGRGALKLPPEARAASSTNATSAGPTSSSTSNDSSPEPGLVRVNADDVWARGIEGQGVVVAGADTGVRWTHRALKNQYRGWDGNAATHDYNWKDGIHATTWPPDAANPCNPGGPTGTGQPSPAPCDDDELLGGGHGSHTVGSMVGDDGGSNRIGMAPRAEWIACRNMSRGVGAMTTYLQCMEWFIAPTKVDGTSPDPSKAPHVVNNSWGCVEGCPPEPNPLRDTLKASRAAGIVYVASAGNDGDANHIGIGPSVLLCNTIYHPLARYPEAFTVGSTTHTTDTISNFSSRGPSAADPENPGSPLYIKPNITAPGSNIRSALQGSDTEYGSLSGTSMAGPHVAGLVALVISANPRLAGKVDRIEEIIEQTAVRKTTNEACGLDTSTQVPNNTYGWGRIDALSAILDALPPDAVDDESLTGQNEPVLINVLLNDTDPDGDTLTIGAVGAAGHGTVTNHGDRLTYTPANGFSGVDSFTYTACAPEGCDVASDTATVVVEVVSNAVPGNHAAAANGATAAASSVYPNGNFSAASAIDSDRTGRFWGAGGGWADATRGLFPDWLEVTFGGARRINEVRVYTLQDGYGGGLEPTAATGATLDGLIDFDVQYWDGSQWVTPAGGAVRGNALALRAVVFPEVTTAKIRVLVHNARNNFSRVVELEAYGPPTP